MTRSTILESVKGLRIHCQAHSNEEKGRMLDQFTMVTGRHRKAAIRLLRRECQAKVKRRRGRRRRYGRGEVSMAPEIVAQLCRTSSGETRPRDAGSVTPPPPSEPHASFGTALGNEWKAASLPASYYFPRKPAIRAARRTGDTARTHHLNRGR